MDIKLLAPIVDATMMASFSNLYKLHHKTYLIKDLPIQDHSVKFHDF